MTCTIENLPIILVNNIMSYTRFCHICKKYYVSSASLVVFCDVCKKNVCSKCFLNSPKKYIKYPQYDISLYCCTHCDTKL